MRNFFHAYVDGKNALITLSQECIVEVNVFLTVFDNHILYFTHAVTNMVCYGVCLRHCVRRNFKGAHYFVAIVCAVIHY